MVLSSSFPRAYYDPGGVTGGNAAYYFVRQLVFAALGVAVMLFASRLPMGFYRRYAFPFLLLTFVLLALVPVIGVRANGARGCRSCCPADLFPLRLLPHHDLARSFFQLLG